jgi:hypothetical protein
MSGFVFVLEYYLSVCLELHAEETHENKLWLLALMQKRERMTSNSEYWTLDLEVWYTFKCIGQGDLHKVAKMNKLQVHGDFERNTPEREFLEQNILFILYGENVHKQLTHGRSPQFKASRWLSDPNRSVWDRSIQNRKPVRKVIFACNCGFTNL